MVNGTSAGCVKIPGVPDDLKITLPFGGEIKAFRDFSQGIPSDCTLAFNLLLQIPPLLGSLGCFLKLLDVVVKLKDFINAPMDPSKAVGVLTAIEALSACFPPTMVITIKTFLCDILRLVVKLLRCIVEAVDSVVDARLGIDLSTAEGNPALLDVLQCANDNATLTGQHVLAALRPLTPLFEIIKPIGDIVQIDLPLPSLDDLEGGDDLAEMTGRIRTIVTDLEKVIETIC